MKLKQLVSYLDKELDLAGFAGDHSNNGLQVEGKDEVSHLIFGVDACQELFDIAAEKKADFVFVHHGLSWGGEPRRFTGTVARRLEKLFNAGISLYAAHLPLDAHPVAGNNAQLAEMVGLKERLSFFRYDGVDIGFRGHLADPAPGKLLAQFLGTKLNVDPLFYGDPEREARHIAIVSGGGGLESLEEAAAKGCDLLITGEFDHVMFHPRQELDVNVIALGHYASETTGPLALMRKVMTDLDLHAEFVDIPTGL